MSITQYNWQAICKYLILVFLLLSFTNKVVAQDFEVRLRYQEKTLDGKIIKQINNTNVIYNLENNALDTHIPYKQLFIYILSIIIEKEKNFDPDNTFFIENILDQGNHTWTFSITLKDNSSSITHFISHTNNKTIEGWINHDNKDLFGLNLFNF